jgi:hypothetical protein
MTINYPEVKPSPEEIAHYGVKGMKWGQRKHTIVTARKRAGGLGDKTADAEQAYLRARNSGNKKATAAAEKKLQDAHTKEERNRLIAGTATRGEQVALLLIGGPIGALVIADNKIATRDSRKIKPYNVDKLKNIDPED